MVSIIPVLGGYQETGASAVLCKLVALVFRNERLKYMGQTLHFIRYIHKENAAIRTASFKVKGIS